MNEDDLHIPDDPRHDQHDALLRDLDRLLELTRWYLPDPSAPVTDAFPHMDPDDAAEVRGILDRIPGLGEDPGTTRARQVVLLNDARMENALLDLLRDGNQVTDPATGKPVRDPAFDATCRDLLAHVRQERAEVSGIPADDAT